MKIINYTPFAVNILARGEVRKTLHTFPTTGHRVLVDSGAIEEEYGFPIRRGITVTVVPETGNPFTLPDPQDGISYIVNSFVREAMPRRSDLLSVTDPVRDAKGIPIGCMSLEGNDASQDSIVVVYVQENKKKKPRLLSLLCLLCLAVFLIYAAIAAIAVHNGLANLDFINDVESEMLRINNSGGFFIPAPAPEVTPDLYI